MSRALLEAMAMRRPVVATRVGAVPEKLAREGAVVEPGDLEGLTHALGAVLRSHAKQGRLAELGYGAATEFGLDHMVNSVAEVYEALGPRG